MLNSPAISCPSFSYSMKPYRQTLRRCWTVRPCSPKQHFQLSSANNEQAITYLSAQYWEKQQLNVFTRTVFHTNNPFTHQGPVLVLIFFSDICFKMMSSWNRNIGPITGFQDGHQRETRHQNCRCCSTLEDYIESYLPWQYLTPS